MTIAASKHTHKRTRTHTRTHPRARTHARTHTHTHTHTVADCSTETFGQKELADRHTKPVGLIRSGLDGDSTQTLEFRTCRHMPL